MTYTANSTETQMDLEMKDGDDHQVTIFHHPVLASDDVGGIAHSVKGYEIDRILFDATGKDIPDDEFNDAIWEAIHDYIDNIES